MFSVSLYTFQKRRNSTKRPTTPDLTLSGEIKEDFTPLSFAMTFNFADNGQIPAYNYAYIANFGRYYYITDWVFVGGQWRGSFTCDVLATYKTEILASNQFVSRCASEKMDGLTDTSYPTISGSNMGSEETVAQFNFWGTGFEDGTIVMGVIGNSDKNTGAVTYYALSVDGYNTLMDSLLDNISWASITDISANLQKALVNPMQYVASVVWLPLYDMDFIGSSGAPQADIVQTIRLGWWDFSIAPTYYARILHNPLALSWDYTTRKKYISLGKHPQSASRGAWLTLAPYSKYVFTFLPFGQFELDTTELYGFEYMGFDVRIHSYTGDAILTLYAAHDDQGTSDKVLMTVNANVGVPLPVGQISLDIGNMDSALTSAALMGATEIASNLSTPAVETTRSTPSAHSKTTHSQGGR